MIMMIIMIIIDFIAGFQVTSTAWYTTRIPDPKEKTIEKTYIHLQGLKKKWYQVMLFVSLQYLMTSYNTQYK